MRIDLEDLSTARFSLALPGPDHEERQLVVRDARQLGGMLETSPAFVRLQGTRAHSLTLEALDWRSSSVHVQTESTCQLEGLGVEFDLARAGQGERSSFASARVEVERVGRTRVSVSPGGWRVAGTTDISNLSVAFDRHDTTKASLASFLAEEVQTALLGMLVRVARVTATRVMVHALATPDQASANSLQLQLESCALARVSAAGRGMDASLVELALDSGVEARFASGSERAVRVHLPVLTLASAEVCIEDLAALGQRGPASDADADASRGDLALGALVDRTQLDRLSGKLHADITVDATLPVIGRRVATHEIRLPIADGLINYKQLEDGLSALEDAVLDFEHKGEYLVLERDIPVIRKRKDLVRWPLPTEEDRFLAAQKSVRLVNLLTPTLPERKEDERPLELSRVDICNLELELTAVRAGGEAPPDGQDDPEQEPAITDIECDELRLTGGLSFVPGSDEAPAGRLCLDLKRLSFSISGLEVSGYRVNARNVIIGGVSDARIEFAGIAPRSLALTIRDVRVEGLTVERPTTRESPASG